MVRASGPIRTAGFVLAAVFAVTSAHGQQAEPLASSEIVATHQSALPAFTPLKVMLNEELSSQQAEVGDRFTVTVLDDVAEQGTIVIPKGTIGHGEVTFASRKGGFGKPGIIGIALRSLDLGGRRIELDGRYREEGRNNNGAVAASWLAVGVFSGFIKGRAGFIEKGRELRARTGEPITFAASASAPPATTQSSAVADPAAAQATLTNGGN